MSESGAWRTCARLAQVALRGTYTYHEDAMGMFVEHRTTCQICREAIPSLGIAVSFPHFDGPGIVGTLRDGFAHRACTLTHPAVDEIRSAWSRQWGEQARVLGIQPVLLDGIIAYRSRRTMIISCEHFFVIEEDPSATELLLHALSEPPESGRTHDLPLNSYRLSLEGAAIVWRVTIPPRSPAVAAFPLGLTLLDLRLSPEGWKRLAATIRAAIASLE